MIDTEIIVLKTSPYGDNSLIIQALSSAIGRISILAKGAKKINRTTFPQIGLFRVLSVSLIEGRSSDLYTLKDSHLIQSNDQLASHPDLLEYISALSNFSLCSNFAGLPCPLFHHALAECLKNLTLKKMPFSAWTCRLIICHLMEQGIFPEMKLNHKQELLINKLLDQDFANHSIALSGEEWHKLLKWCVEIAKYAQLELPQSPFFSAC
jgi:DNA repair protein RecO